MRVVLTHIPDSWAWMWPDLLIRILPFTVVAAGVELFWRPSWLGVSPGRVGVQVTFAAIGAPVLFVTAALVKLWLARRRGVISVPAGPGDTTFQAGFYLINGPVEEAIFRGLIQGGVGAFWGPPAGFIAGTLPYVLYHRIAWPWPEALATALIGVPLGLAYWLLPGPASLLGVAIVHVAATCGFLGPGPYLLKKLRFVP